MSRRRAQNIILTLLKVISARTAPNDVAAPISAASLLPLPNKRVAHHTKGGSFHRL